MSKPYKLFPSSLLVFILMLSSYFDLCQAAPSFQYKTVVDQNGDPIQSVGDIAQDELGFIWFGTMNGLHRYDGYKIKTFLPSNIKKNSLSSHLVSLLHLDKKGNLWAATFNQGLNLRLKDGFKQYSKSNTNLDSNEIHSLASTSQGLWVGTASGLNFLDYTTDTFSRYKINNQPSNLIRAILPLNDNELLIATDISVYNFNLKQQTFSSIRTFEGKKRTTFYRKLYKDQSGTIWQGTQDGLYIYKKEDNAFRLFSDAFNDIPILDMVSDNSGLWVASWKNGLFLITTDEKIHQYQHDTKDLASLSGMTPTTLFKDRNNTIWLSVFDGSVQTLKAPNSLGRMQHSYNLKCQQNPFITAFHPINKERLLLGTLAGLYSYNYANQKCQNISPYSDKTAYQINKINDFLSLENDQVAVSTDQGISLLDLKTNQYIDTAYQNIYSHFLAPFGNGQYLQGTKEGLFLYKNHQTPIAIEVSEPLKQAAFYDYQVSNTGQYIFATDRGLATRGKSGLIKLLNPKGDIIINTDILAFSVDKDIWIGVDSNELLRYSLEGDFIDRYPFALEKEFLPILSIVDGGDGTLWSSTRKGLYRVNKTSKAVQQFRAKDGLQDDVFLPRSAASSNNGKLFFGGIKGFNSFFSQDIPVDEIAPKVKFTELRRFNTIIEPEINNEQLSIKQPIEYLKTLQLGHKDSLVSIQFSGLHFDAPNRVQYAYRINGFHEQWITTTSNNRQAVVSGLNPGRYSLEVKAANKDGIWNLEKDNAVLNIIVKPAPWFSWWAITSYITIIVLSILYFIHYRTQSSVKKAQLLELEVSERTLEIRQQKNTIESLLERKEQLFANISHEFRTPLTLILGPLEQELRSIAPGKTPDNLLLIQRNAQRLLGMVEQILKLTELKEKPLSKRVQSISENLQLIVNSFEPLANSKNINLSLNCHQEFKILCAKDALEIMLGNLLSNAIKYTPNGGSVIVNTQQVSKNQQNYLQIDVKDTGIGISPQQQTEIFERFVRLEQTSDIAGTGIGLSIVKELALAHDGQILIDSQPNKGTQFSLLLPLSELAATIQGNNVEAINHLLRQDVKPSRHINLTHEENELAENILVIDDNLDMQDYICSVLNNSYHCSVASNGQQGIDMAIKIIPDLIICDLMMPGLSGYQVVEQLRADEKSSHIPIILLTAKGDKQSRVLGWDKNIDDFMSKPFDADELRVRIKNIINIRNILREKARQHFSFGEPKQTTEQSLDRIFNKKEQQFLDKLSSIIEQNYQSIEFKKSDMASLMATSERQLQRKIKALLDQTPMELLRRYRLEMSAQYLLDGEPISKVIELCGFSSSSYFSKVFKAFYGSSPKKYQLDNKKQ